MYTVFDSLIMVSSTFSGCSSDEMPRCVSIVRSLSGVIRIRQVPVPLVFESGPGKADSAVFHVVRVMFAERVVGDASEVIAFAAER